MSYILNMLTAWTIIYCSSCNLFIEKLTIRQYIRFGIVLLLTMIPGFYMANFNIIPMILITAAYLFFKTKNGILNICSFLSGYMICVVEDNIIGSFINYVLQISTLELQGSMKLTIISAIPEIILIFLTSLYAGKLIRSRFSKIPELIASRRVQMLLLLNLSLCTLIFAINIIAGEQIGYPAGVIYFNTAVFLVYFIVSTIITLILFRAYAAKADNDLRRQSYENLQDYTKKLETMYDDLKMFRHDYVNSMTSMSGYIESRNMKGLKTYYSEQIIPLRQHILKNNTQLNQLMHIQQLELKSLLSAKLLHAMELNISVSIDIPEPVDKVAMNPVDFSRVIGAWIDNAVEAARETTDPQLSCSIRKNTASTQLVIANTFIDRGIPIHQMQELSFSTKGEGRGLGLYNANKIIQSYPNLLKETSIQNHLFIQYLEIGDEQ